MHLVFGEHLVQAGYARVAFGVLGKFIHILKCVYTFKNVFQSVIWFVEFLTTLKIPYSW